MKTRTPTRTPLLIATAFLVAAGSAACTGAGSATDDPTLTWTTGTRLGTLDVVADQVNGTTRRLLLGSVLEGLTKTVNRDDKLSWEPLLATDWKRVGPTRWRFEIRQGVTFQDGSTLDSEDVAFSVDKLASPKSAKDSTLENIAGANVVDADTVDVLTHSPDFFAYRAMAAIPIQPDGWGVDNVDEAQNTAIGTGPYQVTDVSTAHDHAVLEKWDGYWGDDKAYFDQIEMNVVPDSGSRLASLQAGESDVAFDLAPDLLEGAPATIEAASTEIDILRISTATDALADARVRQALNYAVDRETLIDDVRSGFALPPKGQGVTKQVHGHDPSLQDYPYKPDLAADLVQQAGAEGAELTMMCVSDYYGTVGTDTCQTLKDAYESIGLSIKLQLLPQDQWVEQGLLAPENNIPAPDLFYVQAGSGTLDSTLYFENYYTCGDERATFCDESLKADIRRAEALEDPEAQRLAYQKIHDQIHELAPMVWITSPKNAVATTDGIEGTLYSDAYATYWSEWSRS